MKHALMLAALATPLVALAEEPQPSFTGEAELGATITTGNTKTTSVKGRVDMRHNIMDWDNQYLLEGLFKEDEDIRTAENYRGLLQGNYRFTPTNYMFINLTHEVDKFAGFDSKTTGAAGYGHRFFEQGSTILDVEIGPGVQSIKYSEPNDMRETDWVAHGVLNFATDISENATFKQIFVVDAGKKVTGRSETSVSASLIGALAMKVALVVKYDSEPQPTFEKTDTETNVTLLYKF
ncbi:DUF481 domain-containing protein [Paraferrimonas sedimenticola]|uniref:DUF481 domain-containing protein n=1 Tax=Paraferrimonas sedimenticola TaxID=375674 RepID=A0AA37RVR2_9GAMM|nr:DUF481 domain-containing protein [Paraferrimonas sedimenticola]GLP95557.1 hypothetical protein GCM10007895_08630 [Paraferrimonas sedimenticola]